MITLMATDPENDALSFELISAPAFAALSSNTLTLAPDFTNAGTHLITVQVTDGQNNTQATFTLTVTNLNRAPVWPAPSALAVAENATSTTTVTATDADGDALAYSIVTGPSFAQLTGGTLTLAPDFSASGAHSVVLSASDGTTATTTTLAITVSNTNRAPTWPTLVAVTVSEGNTLPVTLSASDADGDPLTYSLVSGPAFASVLNSTLTLSPATGSSGSFMLTLRANDGAATADGTLQVTVNDVNNPPTLQPLADVAMTAGTTQSVTLIAADPDGDTLQFSTQNLPSWASLAGTTLTLSPGATVTESRVITVTVSDGALSLSRSFTVSVTPPANGIPTLSALTQVDSGDVTVAAGASVTAAPRLRATLDDPENAAVKLEVEVVLNTSGFTGTPTQATPLGAEGTLTLTLPTLSPGTWKWQARAVDQQGAASAWQQFGTGAAFTVVPGALNGTLVINSGAQATNNVAVTLAITATPSSGGTLTQMRFANDGGAFSTLEAFATSKAWTIPSTPGVHTVSVEVRDSNAALATFTANILLDVQGPVFQSAAVNAGALFTRVTSVSLTSNVQDTSSGVLRVEASNDGTTFVTLTGSPASWTVPVTDGLKTITLRATDVAGNVVTTQVSITLDTQGPVLSGFLLYGAFNPNGGSWDYATTSQATASFTVEETTDSTFVFCQGPASPPANCGPFNVANPVVDLGANEGPVTRFIRVIDPAGNASNIVSDAIVVDWTPPTLSNLVLASGAPVVNNRYVGLTYAANDTGSGIGQGEGSDTAFATAPVIGTPTLSGLQVAAGDGTKTISVRVRDAAGNVSPTLSGSVYLDQTGPAGTAVLANGASYVNTASVSVSLSATDAVGAVTHMCLKFLRTALGPPTAPLSNDACFVPYATTATLTMAQADAEYTLSAYFRDAVLNVSPIPAIDTVMWDTIAPTALLSTNADHRLVTVRVAGNFNPNAPVASAEYGLSLTPGGPYTWTSIAPSTSIDLELSNGVTRYFVGRVTDTVGNVSAVSAEQAATPNFPAHLIVNRLPTPNDLFGFTRHAGVLFMGGGGGALYSGTSPDLITTRRDGMTDDTLRALHSDGTRLWVAGAAGHIGVSNDDGVTFIAKMTGTTRDLYGFTYAGISGAPLNSRRWVAVGASGTIVRAAGVIGPSDFAPVTSGTTNTLRAVTRCDGTTAACTANTVLAVGDSGTILRSTDSGATWTTITPPASHAAVSFRAVGQLPGSSTLLIGGQVGSTVSGLIRSTDGGLTWSALAIAALNGYDVNSLQGLTTTTALIGGLDNAVPRVSLVTVSSSLVTDLFTPASNVMNVYSWGSGNHVALGLNGRVSSNRPSGTWTDYSVGDDAELRDVAADYGSAVSYAVGVSGNILRLNGSTLTKMPMPVTTHLNAVVRRSSTSFVAVGDSGVILHSSNAGMTWTPVGLGLTTARLTSVSCAPTTLTWCVAVGDAGTILTFNGSTWAVDLASGSSTSNYTGVVIKSNITADNGIIVGSGGVVRAYAGRSWGAAQTLPGGYALNAAALDMDGQLGLAVGVGGITFSTSDGGASWTLRQSYLASRLAFRDVVMVQRPSQSPMFGAITSTGLLVSTDSGTTWATRWQPLSGTLNGIGDKGTSEAGSAWHLVGNGGAWSRQ